MIATRRSFLKSSVAGALSVAGLAAFSRRSRLYGVLDGQLGRTGAHVAGAELSIADMAILPWVRTWKAQQVPIDEFPRVKAWYERLMQRPALQRALDVGKELRAPALTEEARKALFGQTASSVKAGTHRT